MPVDTYQPTSIFLVLMNYVVQLLWEYLDKFAYTESCGLE